VKCTLFIYLFVMIKSIFNSAVRYSGEIKPKRVRKESFHLRLHHPTFCRVDGKNQRCAAYIVLYADLAV
jgi:hypothetical protein